MKLKPLKICSFVFLLLFTSSAFCTPLCQSLFQNSLWTLDMAQTPVLALKGLPIDQEIPILHHGQNTSYSLYIERNSEVKIDEYFNQTYHTYIIFLIYTLSDGTQIREVNDVKTTPTNVPRSNDKHGSLIFHDYILTGFKWRALTDGTTKPTFYVGDAIPLLQP